MVRNHRRFWIKSLHERIYFVLYLGTMKTPTTITAVVIASLAISTISNAFESDFSQRQRDNQREWEQQQRERQREREQQQREWEQEQREREQERRAEEAERRAEEAERRAQDAERRQNNQQNWGR